jgi:excinuclease ABC subunit A
VLYVLDEPSIGLHQRDNDRLLTTLKNLRDQGNTVIVVEHDEEAIREADTSSTSAPARASMAGRSWPGHAGGDRRRPGLHHRPIPGRRARDRGARRTPQGQGQELSVVKATGNNLKNVTPTSRWASSSASPASPAAASPR